LLTLDKSATKTINLRQNYLPFWSQTVTLSRECCLRGCRSIGNAGDRPHSPAQAARDFLVDNEGGMPTKCWWKEHAISLHHLATQYPLRILTSAIRSSTIGGAGTQDEAVFNSAFRSIAFSMAILCPGENSTLQWSAGCNNPKDHGKHPFVNPQNADAQGIMLITVKH
jgi:hypothetical protein